MNVLSLFDGMSCGQQALERTGIKIDNYYASEIDKHAISITQKNYPNTVQLGSVVNVDVHTLDKIDLLIGGSPCQSFSFAGKRKGMSTKDEIEILSLEQYLQLKNQNFEFEGQSYLFWEYMRILNDLRNLNPDIKFLLENVMMGEKWEKVLSKAIGVNPIEINSSLVSAQNRKRLYWTNIGMKASGLFGDFESVIIPPKDKYILLKDILEKEVDEKYFLSEKIINRFIDFSKKYKTVHDEMIIVHNLMTRGSSNGNGGSGHLTKNDGKTYCLDTGNTNAVEIRQVRQLNKNNQSNNNTQPFQQNRVYDINGISPALQAQLANGSTMINTSRIRRLTPIECERLQTVNDGYTDGVSDNQRYRMLGNGWTVDVIAHILNYLK
jgi:DNA (cytosine-5)-methyltransferase 3A